MTRAFAFLNKKNFPQIGVEWNGVRYNFSVAWDIFKQIKLDRTAPDLPFLQLMVELDLFHAETFDEVFTTLKDFRPLDDLKLKQYFRLQVPISRPQKILCIGRNYTEHAKELGNKPATEEPVFFAKSVSSMIAHEEPVRLPRLSISNDLKEGRGRVDHEVELALVIGKTASNIATQYAHEFIAGYTIMNDVTARELQKKDAGANLPWFRAKSFDTFCPVGPYLIPAESVPNPQALNLQLTVNDQIRQKGSTADMIFPVTELVSYLSRFCTLQPGDIIATGTPSGVGPIQPGDVMVASIEGFGDLKNPVA
ncbi:fumarylacetoacetate hydrolase family protein [candidate division KSB1 bacterium]|nr:fumarylacetoacetate hydrolase family protein [candidate division KSB1 bacterium]